MITAAGTAPLQRLWSGRETAAEAHHSSTTSPTRAGARLEPAGASWKQMPQVRTLNASRR